MALYVNKTGAIAYVIKTGTLRRVPVNGTIELTEAEAKEAKGFKLVQFNEQEEESPRRQAIIQKPVQTIKKKVQDYASDTIKDAVAKLLPDLLDQMKDTESSGDENNEGIKQLNEKLDLLLNREPQQVIVQQGGEVKSQASKREEELYIPDINVGDDSAKEVRVNVEAKKSTSMKDKIAALKKMKKGEE